MSSSDTPITAAANGTTATVATVAPGASGASGATGASSGAASGTASLTPIPTNFPPAGYDPITVTSLPGPPVNETLTNLSIMRGPTNPRRNSYTCPICHVTESGGDHWRRHLANHVLTCGWRTTNCGRHFATHTDLAVHVNNTHGDGDWRCPFYGKPVAPGRKACTHSEVETRYDVYLERIRMHMF